MPTPYQVIAQRQQTSINAANQFVRQWEITFTIPSGATGTVDIPNAQYSAEYIHSVIQPVADQMAAVEKLGGLS